MAQGVEVDSVEYWLLWLRANLGEILITLDGLSDEARENFGEAYRQLTPEDLAVAELRGAMQRHDPAMPPS